MYLDVAGAKLHDQPAAYVTCESKRIPRCCNSCHDSNDQSCDPHAIHEKWLYKSTKHTHAVCRILRDIHENSIAGHIEATTGRLVYSFRSGTSGRGVLTFALGTPPILCVVCLRRTLGNFVEREGWNLATKIWYIGGKGGFTFVSLAVTVRTSPTTTPTPSVSSHAAVRTC